MVVVPCCPSDLVVARTPTRRQASGGGPPPQIPRRTRQPRIGRREGFRRNDPRKCKTTRTTTPPATPKTRLVNQAVSGACGLARLDDYPSGARSLLDTDRKSDWSGSGGH